MSEIASYLPLALGLGAAAIVAGLMAGFLGVGGGIVLVPVLFWLFTFIDFPDTLSMHMAVATSLATIVFTAISSMRAHHKRGAVDVPLLRKWGVPVGLGALAGGLVARFIDPAGLKMIFGFVALLVSANLATPRTLVVSDHLPESRAANAGIAGAIGLVSSLMGIGGGTLGVPTLAAFSYPIHRAVGTAAAFGLIIALPAVAGFVLSGLGVPDRPPLSAGYVSLPAALIIIPFTTALAPVGAKLAHDLDAKWVKRGFALFLGITAVRMLIAAFG